MKHKVQECDPAILTGDPQKKLNRSSKTMVQKYFVTLFSEPLKVPFRGI